MAVKLAVAAKDADIARMQRQLAELEEQAQAELGDMHEELLEMRQACHALEIALNESEIKRLVHLMLSLASILLRLALLLHECYGTPLAIRGCCNVAAQTDSHHANFSP